MAGWLKIFKDNTKEYGGDEDIAKGKASWSRGKLDNIAEVRISNNRQTASLSVQETSWHQFDRLMVGVSVGTQHPTVTHRVIQAEVKPHHVGKSLICSNTGGCFFWAVVDEPNASSELFSKQITEAHVGKWITLILPERDYPSIAFSVRGKMNDNQRISR
jgi:hypothetical protein